VATILLIILLPLLFAALMAYLVIRAGVALLQLCFLPARLDAAALTLGRPRRWCASKRMRG